MLSVWRFLLLLAVGVAGCTSGVQVLHLPAAAVSALRPDEELSRQAREHILEMSRKRDMQDYRIGIKDVLNIEVWQQDRPQIQRTAKVRTDGEITFPLIGNVKVDGLTEAEVARAVEERITEFIKQPFVSVQVTAVGSKKVYVFGEIAVPGVMPLADQYRLLDVILNAGGVTPDADLAQALFIRGEEVLPVDFYGLLRQGRMDNNVYVQNDDKVLIPSLRDNRVFVFGEVQQPGVVFIDRDLFLMDAVSACQGLTAEANPAGVRIIRGSLTAPAVYVADINELIAGNIEHNVHLERGDIVFVPAKGIVHWHRFMSRLLPSLTDIYLIRQLATSP